MSDKRTILRGAGVVGGLTLVSRCAGLVRDVVLSAKLGDGVVSNVFYTAFEIPNLVRRVMGEGSLSVFIVSLLTKRRAERGSDEGWVFFNRTANLMLLVSCAIVLAGMCFPKQAFVVFGGLGMLLRGKDLVQTEQYLLMGARFTRIMFPFTAALTLAAVMMGACHTLRSFVAPSMGSVMLNLSLIAAGVLGLVMGVGFETGAVWLCWAVVVGAVLRVVIMIPTLRRHGWRWRPSLTLHDAELRRLLAMMGLGFLGVAVGPLTMVMTSTFAMFLGGGVKTYTVYSNRLIQFPMALTASAVATAMLPQMSRYLLEGRNAELREMMTFTKRLELILMVPAVAGLMVFGLPILRMLFERGNWSAEASMGTYRALAFYAPGLIPLGWARIYTQLYYARHDVLTPIKGGLAGLAATFVLNLVFVRYTPLAQSGLAIAATLGVCVNYAWLARGMRATLAGPERDAARLGETAWKTTAAALVATGLCWGSYQLLVRALGTPDSTLTRAAMLVPFLVATALFYFAALRLLRAPDSAHAIEMLMKKLRRG